MVFTGKNTDGVQEVEGIDPAKLLAAMLRVLNELLKAGTFQV